MIFLTARYSTDDRVHGLTIGGDDYIPKPFAVAELVARVKRSLSRRGAADHDPVLRCADLEMDETAHRVTRAGAAVSLSPTEYALLRCLLINTGRVLTRAQILDNVWQYDFDGDSSVVDTVHLLPPPQGRPHRTEAHPHDPRRRLLPPRES